MRIGLIDVDGHNFPNLPLMKISAYHKAKGDEVEMWWGWGHYDIVYMSKVFDDTYTADHAEPVNSASVIKGGTGYFRRKKNVYTKSEIPAILKEWKQSVNKAE